MKRGLVGHRRRRVVFWVVAGLALVATAAAAGVYLAATSEEAAEPAPQSEAAPSHFEKLPSPAQEKEKAGPLDAGIDKAESQKSAAPKKRMRRPKRRRRAPRKPKPRPAKKRGDCNCAPGDLMCAMKCADEGSGASGGSNDEPDPTGVIMEE